MKRILLISFMLMSALISEAWAQRTVTGQVTGADGEGLPGVSVRVKGTNSGVITDFDGNYRLQVPEGANALVFSFVGFERQEVQIGNRSVIDIALAEDVQQLQEVVVTALGIERSKNELPYAAQSVDGEQVSQQRTANFVDNLSGRVAGLRISQGNTMGGSSNVIIRGSTSLTGNNQALFVIDGVPVDNSVTNTANQRTGRGGYDYGNAAADINPDDIESVNVLKGAAATVLYGSRAANGAILITTKKGSQGLGVTINSGVQVGLVNKNTFVEYQKEYGAGYGRYYGPNGDAYFNQQDMDGDGDPDLVVPTSDDAGWGAPFDPNLNVWQWHSFNFGSGPLRQGPTPWVAAENDPTTFFQSPVNLNNSVFIDGGNEQGTFKLGYTRNDQEGILPNSQITKNMVNFAGSYNVSDRLSANASINFTRVDGLGRYGTGYDGENLMQAFRQWWQPNVDIEEQRQAYFRDGQNYTWNFVSPDNLAPAYMDNPYWVRYENYQNDNRSRYFGYAALTYRVADWLNIMGRVSLDSYDEMQEERRAVGSNGVSGYSRFNRSYREYNYDLMGNYKTNIGEAFSLSGAFGTNIRRTFLSSIQASTNGGLLVPGLYSLANSANPLEAPQEIDEAVGVDGIFASATLGYNDLIFLDLAARRDVSSTLPAGNNEYYYPSVSTSFVFSELVEPNPIFTYGKLRANYAEVGNTAPALYVRNYYSITSSAFGAPLASALSRRNNADLRPERTKSYELGVETTWWDGRAGLDVTYYNMRTVDQILPVEVSRAVGYNTVVINAGEVENQGFEVSAFLTPVQTNDLSWRIGVNWARNRNRVLDLGGIDNLQLGSFQGGVTVNAALGQPYGTIRGQDFVYDENGNRVVGSNGFYLRSASSNEIIGDSNPNWIGGVTNRITYRNFSLDFLVDVQTGGDLFSLDMYYGLATGIHPETAGLNDLGNPVRSPLEEGGGVILPGVKEDGTPNDIRVSAVNFGVFGYRRTPPAGFIYDASYVKLRNLTLTYRLPQTLFGDGSPFQGIDLSLIGNNLWIIHKNMPYADPEAGLSAGNLQGYQSGVYPTTRNVGFNVRVRF